MLPAELNAAAVLIGFWSDLNPAVWISICLIVAAAINVGGTRAYGEVSRVDSRNRSIRNIDTRADLVQMEFWFAIIKVLTIVGLIILGVILSAGGGPDRV